MATTNYNLFKPQVGGRTNLWGNDLNDNMDTIDATMYANQVAAAAAQTTADAALPAADLGTAGLKNHGAAQGDIPLNSNLLVTERVVTANTSLVLNDLGKVVVTNSAANLTVTIPPNASIAFPIGSVVHVYRHGTGDATIVAGNGVTLRNPGRIDAQFGEISLRKRGTNEWVLAGGVLT